MKALFFNNFLSKILILCGFISLVLMLDVFKTPIIANILEGAFMVYAVIAFLWIKKKTIPTVSAIFWISAIYTSLSYLYAVIYKGANLLDFLMIYKSFIYLTFLTFFANKKFISKKIFLSFFNILLVIFFLKYLLMIGLGITDRPIVYVENNFELMLLYALYLVRISITKDHFFKYLFLLGVITLLSLSRSSLLMYSVLMLYVYNTFFQKTKGLIIPLAIVVLSGIIYYIFSQRSGSLEEIDRFKFLLIFLNEVRKWDFLDWLIGAERITPLSLYACTAMGYFKNLFSYSGDGSCYSVILHSFLFRVILDHGIIGLVFILYSTYKLLIISGLKKGITYVFIGVVLINGMSVSSFNNLFFAISMVFLMGTDMRSLKQNERPVDDNIEPAT